MINKMLHKFFYGRAFSKKDLTDFMVTVRPLHYTKSKKNEVRVIWNIFNES